MWRGDSLSKQKESDESGSGAKPISVRPPGKLTQSSGGAMSVGELCGAELAGGCEVGGMQRVGEERVLDIGGDELLVLLLVLEAEGDAARGLGAGGEFGRSFEQAGDRLVDVGAVIEDAGQRRAGRSWSGGSSRASRRASCSRS